MNGSQWNSVCWAPCAARGVLQGLFLLKCVKLSSLRGFHEYDMLWDQWVAPLRGKCNHFTRKAQLRVLRISILLQLSAVSALKEANVCTAAAYRKHWADHLRKMIKSSPKERRRWARGWCRAGMFWNWSSSWREDSRKAFARHHLSQMNLLVVCVVLVALLFLVGFYSFIYLCV